jgi:hypothetical protein
MILLLLVSIQLSEASRPAGNKKKRGHKLFKNGKNRNPPADPDTGPPLDFF